MSEQHQPSGGGQGAAPPGRPRPDASMSLLREHVEHSLDPGYAQAAARRRAAGQDPSRVRPSLLLVVATVLVGLLLAVAAEQARARSGVSGSVSDDLIEEIRERDAANEDLAAQAEALRRSNDAMRDDVLRLTAAGQRAAAELERLEAGTGTGPVTGPGLVVTVDDAPGVDAQDELGGVDAPGEDEGGVEGGRVNDRDLQRVVNGLWAAGAEAVSVNGQRLTSLSAIRNAGLAVLVAYRPLSPPYAVEAVGDPDELETGFVENDGGFYLASVLGEEYGIRYGIEQRDELRLPGGSGVVLRTAVPAEPGP